eukprot:6177143-Pyramimonas_sp.AAC.1
MECWLNRGWSEHQIRRWYSLRQAKRDDDGAIIRSKKGHANSQDAMVERGLKRAIIGDRKALQRCLLHMPQLCRSQTWLPHGAPVKKPGF